jgi:transposase
MTVSQETRALARELYVIDGLTFEQAAERTSVNAATLKRWAKEEDWPGRKERRLRQDLGLKEQYRELQRKVIEQALDTLDPQRIYAAMKLEQMLHPDKEAKETEVDRPRIFLEDLEFIAGVLNEINPEGLKVVAGSFGIIVERFKERHAKAA